MRIADIISPPADRRFRTEDRTAVAGAWMAYDTTATTLEGEIVPARGLDHYSTTMMVWHRDTHAPLYLGTGHGSVSDQNGCNIAAAILGIPARFDRDWRGGGPRWSAIDPKVAEAVANMPHNRAARGE